jgi:hypothetical protein
MSTSSKILFVSVCCLFLAHVIDAQSTVVTSTTTNDGATNVTTAANATSSTTTLTNATNTSALVNETIVTDSSQNGTTIVTTTPIDPTTNTSGTPTNTTITLQQLTGFEQASPNISTYPTQSYTLYLADIHFVSGNLSAQYIAYHYCHFVSEDLMQCALFNDTTPNARFIGNEYFITKALFDTLPEEERNLWHSHPYEVQSGLFVAPDLTPEDEFTVMEWLMGTFGKVTDTWQFTEDFPLGAPKLGMALALDSQVNWDLADQMDQILNLTTTHQERRQQRAELIAPPKTPGADAYLTTGNATQYQVYQIMLENNGTTLPIDTTL